MQPPGSEGRRNYETTGVFSPDGEYLPFVAPIVTEGRPEEWLNTVEEAMFAATKRHLYRVRAPESHLLHCHLHVHAKKQD
jgi:dynein heavy chain